MLMCLDIFWTKHSLLAHIAIFGDQHDRTANNSKKHSYIENLIWKNLLPTGYDNQGNYINKRWKFLITILCDYNLQVLSGLLLKPKFYLHYWLRKKYTWLFNSNTILPPFPKADILGSGENHHFPLKFTLICNIAPDL